MQTPATPVFDTTVRALMIDPWRIVRAQPVGCDAVSKVLASDTTGSHHAPDQKDRHVG